jgi:hypothetical protein
MDYDQNHHHPMNLITPANIICKKRLNMVQQMDAVEATGSPGKKNQIPEPYSSGSSREEVLA